MFAVLVQKIVDAKIVEEVQQVSTVEFEELLAQMETGNIVLVVRLYD